MHDGSVDVPIMQRCGHGAYGFHKDLKHGKQYSGFVAFMILKVFRCLSCRDVVEALYLNPGTLEQLYLGAVWQVHLPSRRSQGVSQPKLHIGSTSLLFWTSMGQSHHHFFL